MWEMRPPDHLKLPSGSVRMQCLVFFFLMVGGFVLTWRPNLAL